MENNKKKWAVAFEYITKVIQHTKVAFHSGVDIENQFSCSFGPSLTNI